MVITFLAPSAKHPIGGVVAIYEFANGLNRRGHDVQLVHVDFIGDSRDRVHTIPDPVESLDDIRGFAFEAAIQHSFPKSFDERDLPDADFIFHVGGRVPKRSGLPVVLVQGYQMLQEPFEHDRLYRAACPKICIAEWLVDVGKRLGVADEQLVHIPYGLDHSKYRVTTPLEARSLQMSMLYNDHPTKAANVGLEAVVALQRRISGLQVVVFGSTDPIHSIPEGATYLTSPPQDVIVDAIYNRSRVFINSSVLEGFGLACTEAMACGCALVTTSNGGSDDYAIDGETALVCEPENATALADRIESLLVDDKSRVRLARRGQAYVRRFDWDVSAERLEAFLSHYRDDPDRFRQRAKQAGSTSVPD